MARNRFRGAKELAVPRALQWRIVGKSLQFFFERIPVLLVMQTYSVELFKTVSTLRNSILEPILLGF